MKFQEKIIITLAMTFLIIVAIGIVFGGLLLGLAGFFSLIGVTYDSFGSLLLFVLYCILIGVVFEIIEIIIAMWIKNTSVHYKMKLLWISLVNVGLTWIVIHIVNDLMTTVSLSLFAEFLTAVIIVSVDIIFDDKNAVK